MRFAIVLLAGTLIPTPDARAGALEALGESGLRLAAQAGDLAAKLSLEERLRRLTTFDLASAPEYLPTLIEQARVESSRDSLSTLRERIVRLENELLDASDKGGVSCQQGLLKRIEEHKAAGVVAARELAEIHAAQQRLLQEVAAALEAERSKPDGIIALLEADALLLERLRARFPSGSQVVLEAQSQLTTSWSRQLADRFASNVEAAAFAVRQAAKAQNLSEERDFRDRFLVVEFTAGGPRIESRSPGLTSSSKAAGAPLYYLSRVGYSVRSKTWDGKDLREALRDRSSEAVYRPERDYVSARARSCIVLAGARLALADK